MSRRRRCSGPTASRSPRAAGSIPRRSRSTARWSMSASSASTSCCASISPRVLRARLAKSCRCRRRRASCPTTRGIEALVMVPKGLPLAGTLIAISERGLDAQGNIIGFLIGGKTPGPVRDPPHRQFRHQRRGAAAVRRSVAAGAQIFLARRDRHPHPARRARLHRARRRDRRARRSSRPISATRSTTWKASTPTSRRRATRC